MTWPDRRILRLEQRRGRNNLHGCVDRADIQSDVQAGGLPDLHNEALDHGPAEALAWWR